MSQKATELSPNSNHPIYFNIPGPLTSTDITPESFPAENANSNFCLTDEAVLPALPPALSTTKSVLIAITLAAMNLMITLLNGVLTVALPAIAADLQLADNLILWPASVYALACGCTLLPAGSVTDVVGSKRMFLTGCILLTAFTLASGFAQTGLALIAFRALSGVSASFCLPSAVSIITGVFAPGRGRNIAFACLGAAQPLGFSIGLFVGGVLVQTIGWRFAYWIVPGGNTVIAGLAVWNLPGDRWEGRRVVALRLAREVDWVGAGIASLGLGLLSYVLAMVTLRTSYIRDPTNIALSALAVALLLAFFWWMHCRERANKSTMIPNSLWRNPIFSSICAAVFVSWAVFATGSYFLTLYFQKVQLLSALQTSYRLLPMVAAGAVTNVATGFLVHRVEANILVTATAALSVVGPLMMALANPTWSYWAGAFVTALLLPIGADTLFTISNLVITSVFPARTHGLAGGVFNTVAQIGNSFGLAIGAVVASTVSAGWVNKTSVPALAAGYRGVFWTCLGAQLAVVVVARWGLRGSGKVGLKSE